MLAGAMLMGCESCLIVLDQPRLSAIAPGLLSLMPIELDPPVVTAVSAECIRNSMTPRFFRI